MNLKLENNELTINLNGLFVDIESLVKCTKPVNENPNANIDTSSNRSSPPNMNTSLNISLNMRNLGVIVKQKDNISILAMINGCRASVYSQSNSRMEIDKVRVVYASSTEYKGKTMISKWLEENNTSEIALLTHLNVDIKDCKCCITNQDLILQFSPDVLESVLSLFQDVVVVDDGREDVIHVDTKVPTTTSTMDSASGSTGISTDPKEPIQKDILVIEPLDHIQDYFPISKPIKYVNISDSLFAIDMEKMPSDAYDNEMSPNKLQTRDDYFEELGVELQQREQQVFRIENFDVSIRLVDSNARMIYHEEFGWDTEEGSDDDEVTDMCDSLDIKLFGISLSATTSNTLRFSIRNIEVFDKVKKSTWRKMLSYYKSSSGYPRETGSNMVQVDLVGGGNTSGNGGTRVKVWNLF